MQKKPPSSPVESKDFAGPTRDVRPRAKADAASPSRTQRGAGEQRGIGLLVQESVVAYDELDRTGHFMARLQESLERVEPIEGGQSALGRGLQKRPPAEAQPVARLHGV